MELVLIVCTILGGVAALWFFWDRLSLHFKETRSFNQKQDSSNNFLSLSDQEFILPDKLMSLPFQEEFHSTSDNEDGLLKSLANQGYFIKTNNDSYKPTSKYKNLRKNVP